MKYFIAVLVSLLLIIGSLIGSLLAVHGKNVFLISNVSVDVVSVHANHEALQRHLNEKLEVYAQKLPGKNLWTLPSSDIAKDLRLWPWVKDVRVQKNFPGKLTIEAEMHSVPFLILDRSGELIAVVADGAMLFDLPAEDLPHVPVVYDKIYKEDLQLRQETIAMIESLPSEGPLQKDKVSDVLYHPIMGFELVMRIDGQRILIGNEEFEKRAERASQVLSYLEKQKLKGRVIDSRFSQKVLVRLRNHQ